MLAGARLGGFASVLSREVIAAVSMRGARVGVLRCAATDVAKGDVPTIVPEDVKQERPMGQAEERVRRRVEGKGR